MLFFESGSGRPIVYLLTDVIRPNGSTVWLCVFGLARHWGEYGNPNVSLMRRIHVSSDSG